MFALCREAAGFSNYLMSFPPGATVEQKKLLITAILSMDYQVCASCSRPLRAHCTCAC